MGELINLLNAQPKLYDGPPRHMDPTFGEAYFDGTRDTGYGGYRYDGRWQTVCTAMMRRYALGAGSLVLDVGCAKGFFLAAFRDVCPGIEVCGIDVSTYALSQAPPPLQPFLSLSSADSLEEFPDHAFDFVAAMNSLHFLPPERVQVALEEMLRVGQDKFFIQVDAYTTAAERERLLAWAPIIKTVYSVEEWLALFRAVGYAGDYYWTFVRPLAA